MRACAALAALLVFATGARAQSRWSLSPELSTGAGYSDKVLANVVSNEDNVEGVLTKVESGEADAGFVYVTDSKAAGSAVATIVLPAGAQAVATYPIGVVKSSAHAADAQAFVAFVLGPTGQGLLADAGFGPPAG